MTTYHISVEPEFASCVGWHGVTMTQEIAQPRATFTNAFSGIDWTTVRQLSYEPDRSLYHIVEPDWSVTVLDAPTDDSRMQYVYDNIDSIVSWFQAIQDELDAAMEPIE